MSIVTVDDDLKSLGSCKEYFSEVFFLNEDVRKLVMPSLDDSRFDERDNFFGGKKLKYFNPSSKEYEYADLPGHCFDFPYVDEKIVDSRALITMDSFLTKAGCGRTKEIQIDIFALSHKDFIRMDEEEKASYTAKGYAGNRVDMMVSAIELAMKYAERPKDFGIGRIFFKPENPITLFDQDKQFYGKKISLLCSDFFIKPKNLR